MVAVISLLRAVNVGGHNKIKMEELRALYESIGLHDAQTYVQSGNVVFSVEEKKLRGISGRIEDAIEREFAFRSDVIVRTASEMRDVIARNPFAARSGIEPNKLLVSFLSRDPGEESRKKIRQIKAAPEEMLIDGRELYIFFPNGMGRTKLPYGQIEKALKTPATGRNWNTVTKLLAMAEKLEATFK